MHTTATGPAAATPGEDGHAARRSLKSGRSIKVAQARGGQGSEAVSEGEQSCSAQQAKPSVDKSTSKGRAKGLRRGSGSGTEAEKRSGPPAASALYTDHNQVLLAAPGLKKGNGSGWVAPMSGGNRPHSTRGARLR